MINKRLEKHPYEVVVWREIQNNLKGTQKDSICEVLNELQSNNSDNANLFYLKVRCMEDGKQQDDLFIEGSEKWKNNAWLAYASGYVYAGKQNWSLAYESFGTAMSKEPQLMNSAATIFERIHKMMSADELAKEEYNDLLSESEEVNFYRRLENNRVGEFAGEPFYTYSLIAQNKMADAIIYAADYPDLMPYFNWSIASSEAASKEQIELVLSYSMNEGISPSTIWMALALRFREGKQIIETIDRLREMYSFTDQQIENTKEFLKLTQQGRYDAADALLKEDNFYFQYTAFRCMMGMILKGNDVPEDWKKQVEHLLFISEKPYFGEV